MMRRSGELDNCRRATRRQVARKPLPGEPAFRHAEHHDLRGDLGLKRAVIVRRQRALQTVPQ